MTPKTELFGRIEDYCLNLLDAKEKQDFENELAHNEELREEVKLHKDIQDAVLELDVLALKGSLDKIQKENPVNYSENGTFALLDDLKEINELKEELTFEELIDSFESLPKVHAYQHGKAANENIHRFYEEQNGADAGEFENELDGVELEDFEGLEEAILETDILNLRDTLQQVAKSVEPQFSVEDIDSYLNGELGDEILAEFEAELEKNSDLQFEVNLHTELESAIAEDDIMSLRDEMKNIMQAETSWNVSERTIEDFIDGMLEEDLLAEFNAELEENTDLMAEVSLRQQINHAIAETDIQNLRSMLGKARKESEKKEVKSIVMPQFDLKSTRFWRNSVAMIILLVGLFGALQMNLNSAQRTYNKYFETPAWAAERSINETSNLDYLQEARLMFAQSDYENTIQILNKVPETKDAFVKHFYTALSYQNLGEFDQAIKEFTKVINHGNNLFIEEAEWYKSLCYLRLDQKQEAKNELMAVIDRKGYYEKDARAIIRKMKFSIE